MAEVGTSLSLPIKNDSIPLGSTPVSQAPVSKSGPPKEFSIREALDQQATYIKAGDIDGLIKSFTLSAQAILSKINEKFAALADSSGSEGSTQADAASGDRELTPSSDQTADSIVSGIKLLFNRFEKQNPKLDRETLVTEFFSRARSGVEAGYKDAVSTLESLNLYSHEGVKDGVQDTKKRIDEKLAAFETYLREKKSVGGAPAPSPTTTPSVTPPVDTETNPQ